MADNYIRGLLSNAERKNGWQLAEKMAPQYAQQQFLFLRKREADTRLSFGVMIF